MITYTTGQNGYQQVDYDPHKSLLCTFTEQPIFKCNSLRESMQNDVRSLGNVKIAVLFSGGMDSEVVLDVCQDINADFYAVFCLYTYKKMPVNIHELYYVEKYCKEHNVTLKILELDLERFFDGGKYLKYVQTYYCNVAQICPYLWFTEQVDDCLILGGDAPHIVSKDPLTYFPPVLGQVSVERMFAMQKRPGIPNFLTHSYTTMQYCLDLWQQQTLSENGWIDTEFAGKKFSRWAYAKMKHGMYVDGGFTTLEIKPKFSSPFALCADFDITKYDNTAQKIVPHCESDVRVLVLDWGPAITVTRLI